MTIAARPALVYGAAGAALTGLYFALPRGGAAQAALYELLALSSAAAIEAGVRIHRPARALPWHLFAAALALFAIGDFTFSVYEFALDREPPLPSVADVFYLAGYPFAAAGLVLLLRGLPRPERAAALLEAAIVTVAFALAQWVYVMDPVWEGGGSASARLVGLAYPAMDVVLIAGLAGFFVNPVWRTPAYWLLLASAVALLAADEAYGLSAASYASGDWIDAGWLLSYVLWGAAGLHPSTRALSEPARSSDERVPWLRLALLGGALVTAPAVLLAQRLRGGELHVWETAGAAALLAALVIARLGGILRGLEASHRELREADRMKDEFVALISHDLRTPLTSIIGYLELVVDPESGPLSEEQRSHLAVVSRNAARLLARVNDLLFAARLRAGKLELTRSEVDVAGVVRQLVEETGPRAAAAGIALEADVSPTAPIFADRGRLFQLLDNLLSNALKFTPEGGRVTVSTGPGADGSVRIAVADTGIGVAPDELGRLFERFFRATSATERQLPGTGLGLYIAKAIVDAHGGSIAVASEQGRGTTFTVELPR